MQKFVIFMLFTLRLQYFHKIRSTNNIILWFVKQLQTILTDYLDIQNTTNVDISTTETEFVDQSTNINSFFSRRKPTQP